MEERLFWWVACQEEEGKKGKIVSGPHLVVAWSEGEVQVMAGAQLEADQIDVSGIEVVVVPFA